MDEQNQQKRVGCAPIFLWAVRCKTIWFGAASLWLFTSAHNFDDIRHDKEDMTLLFGVPYLLVGAFYSTLAGRLFWACFPNLAPRRSPTSSNALPVVIGLGIALIIAFLWDMSPLLLDLIYDSYKIILLIIIISALPK